MTDEERVRRLVAAANQVVARRPYRDDPEEGLAEYLESDLCFIGNNEEAVMAFLRAALRDDDA